MHFIKSTTISLLNFLYYDFAPSPATLVRIFLATFDKISEIRYISRNARERVSSLRLRRLVYCDFRGAEMGSAVKIRGAFEVCDAEVGRSVEKRAVVYPWEMFKAWEWDATEEVLSKRGRWQSKDKDGRAGADGVSAHASNKVSFARVKLGHCESSAVVVCR